MMWNKQNIFEPSGCISREAFDAFLRDELAPDVRVTAEEHIASCEFCSDASEGFGSIGLPQASVAMEMVDRSFKKKYLEPHKKNTRRITWFSIAAAASVLLLSGLFLILRDNHPKTQLAENTVPLKEKASEPEIPGNRVEKPQTVNTPVVSENQENKKKPHTEVAQPPKGLTDEPPALKPAAAAKVEENKELRDKAALESPVVTEEQEDKKTSADLSSSNRRKEAPAPSSTSAGKAMRSYSDESMEKSAEVTAKKGDLKKDKAFVVVEENASFQGGDIQKFRMYLIEQLSKSDSFQNDGGSVEGVVQFVVDPKGKVTDIKILRSFGADIDKAMIRILKNSPRWIPAKQDGQIVKQQFVLPLEILFRKN
jgi:periplasmic protein TonB